MSELAVAGREFVFEEAPFASCHASTVCELRSGELLAAWFGGEREGAADVAVWLARRADSEEWSAPECVARAEGVPCWNPVLHATSGGEVLLFYKAGPSPQTWTGFLVRSTDEGATWSEPERLPAGVLGPIKNKPLELGDGTLVCGSSVESWRAWACWVEQTTDAGRTWTKHGPITIDGGGCIQPAIVDGGDGRLAMFCRTARVGRVMLALSGDRGQTWSPGRTVDLPHNNSGLDAATVQPSGATALVYNHTTQGRTPLNVAITPDLGETFSPGPVLESEPGEYSYPAIVAAAGGGAHVTYTWRRERIAYVRLTPS